MEIVNKLTVNNIERYHDKSGIINQIWASEVERRPIFCAFTDERFRMRVRTLEQKYI